PGARRRGTNARPHRRPRGHKSGYQAPQDLLLPRPGRRLSSPRERMPSVRPLPPKPGGCSVRTDANRDGAGIRSRNRKATTGTTVAP
ncbi:unnamed protein product, partial [Laminaria digitata]